MFQAFLSETKLEFIVCGWGCKCSDFKSWTTTLPQGELLHKRRPLSTKPNIKINNVNGIKAIQRFKKSLVTGKIGKLKYRRDF